MQQTPQTSVAARPKKLGDYAITSSDDSVDVPQTAWHKENNS
ncbi:MAG: hypothetical protein RR937_05335 [Ruthenibacterium sp.]